jgi:GNAT superfamily N-acetyltransferase
VTSKVLVARPATVDDVPELVRLRGVLFETDGVDLDAGSWREDCENLLRARLSEPEPAWIAYVVEQPDHPGRLACCVLGAIEPRLPSPFNASGKHGHVFSVATDSDYRRRGYARVSMLRLLDWFRSQGVTRVGLNASSDGAPLYESLGFGPSHDPSMRLNLTP